MRAVAVSQRVDAYPKRNEQRDAVDQRLTKLLISIGLLPIPAPNSLFSTSLKKNVFYQWISSIAPSAVILSGGNDIGLNKDRDKVEIALLDHAEEYELPVLGICRGMQQMAVRAGGKLHNVAGHVRTRHLLTGAMSYEVNSYHNQALSSSPPNYNVIARSIDGEIEAIRHEWLPWEGWMWHPEREEIPNSQDIARMKLLLNKLD